jgi:hypothetical protein
MPIPETTSTGGLESYLGGKCLFHGRGEAWRDLKASIVVQPPEGDTSTLPAVSESFLAWTISGEVDFQEREYEGPWITHRIPKGSFHEQQTREINFTSGNPRNPTNKSDRGERTAWNHEKGLISSR